jgi:hypothetical protein
MYVQKNVSKVLMVFSGTVSQIRDEENSWEINESCRKQNYTPWNSRIKILLKIAFRRIKGTFSTTLNVIYVTLEVKFVWWSMKYLDGSFLGVFEGITVLSGVIVPLHRATKEIHK